ncbi:MAG: class I tRNA ligase family protein, partial [Acidobacteriota bacterium]|nr:class I tRNA ligase family protein [Acidobacteriota bacterium]
GAVRPEVHKGSLEILILMISIFTPHIADELWESLGHSEPVLRARWPVFVAALAAEDEIEMAVQINGKVRGRIRAASGVSADEAVATAKSDEKVAPYLEGKQIIKAIVAPGKLISFVVK